jgi:hypothetical protein
MGKKKRKTGMSQKILIGIGISAVIIALIAGFYFIYVYKPAIAKEKLLERFSEFEIQYQEKEAQGYNVSEAMVFVRKAKRAYERKDYKAANGFLDNAFEALERAEKVPAVPVTVKEEAKEKLSKVKVAVLYETVTDSAVINRNVNDVVNILKETNTDFIFRGFWRWHPVPESCSQLPPGYNVHPIYSCEKLGYSYDHLREAITDIKKEMPDVIFCGAVPTNKIERTESNPITGEIIRFPDTWGMALDPAKMGIDMSKEDFQEWFAKNRESWMKQEQKYNPEEMWAYFPDITNLNVQELILDWAKKQIDCGVDAIWLDYLFFQPRLFEQKTGDASHPAVKESYNASLKIVDKIHDYGASKGRYIYVGSWGGFVDFPYPPPNLDFVTVTPSSEEVLHKEFDKEKWNTEVAEIREKLGEDILIFAFMDFGNANSPLATFSQELTPKEQREFLGYADNFLQEKGIVFIYPVHGGSMGVKNVKILSFGEYNVYDSTAPEFETYDTIKELTQSR